MYRSSYHLTPASTGVLFTLLSCAFPLVSISEPSTVLHPSPLPDYQPAPTHPLKPNELTWGVVISLKSNWNLMKFKVINCNYMIFHKNVVVTHVVKASK